MGADSNKLHEHMERVIYIFYINTALIRDNTVKAIVTIDDRTNQILNILKAKYGLRDKSQAINLMAQKFEECIMEPELRPEFIENLKNSQTEKTIKVKDFAQRYSK